MQVSMELNPGYDGRTIRTSISQVELMQYGVAIQERIIEKTSASYVEENYQDLISEIDPRKLMKLVEKEVAKAIAERSIKKIMEDK